MNEVDEVACRLTYRVGARVPNGYFDAIAPIIVEHNPFDTTHYAPSSSGGTKPPWECKRPWRDDEMVVKERVMTHLLLMIDFFCSYSYLQRYSR